MTISNWVDNLSPDPGTAQSDPGTSQSMEGKDAPANSGVEPRQETLSINMIMAISDFVDAVSANPGTVQSVPGTSQYRLAETREEIFTLREVPSWVQPIMSYLLEGTLPENETMARKIQRKSKSYTIINAETYRRSVTGVL